jgi:hypothetical protein
METAVFPDVNGVIAALAIGPKTIQVEVTVIKRRGGNHLHENRTAKMRFPSTSSSRTTRIKKTMTASNLEPERIGELRGFLQGFAKLQQALTIARYNYQVLLLPVEGGVEETLQSHFDALGQKLKPPVKHWEMKLEELKPWEQPVEEMLVRWLLADEELRQFYCSRRERDPRPGELHVRTNDLARAFREQLDAVLGRGKKKVWEVSVHALVGASDRYLADLDDHLAFELGDSLLLLSFAMMR